MRIAGLPGQTKVKSQDFNFIRSCLIKPLGRKTICSSETSIVFLLLPDLRGAQSSSQGDLNCFSSFPSNMTKALLLPGPQDDAICPAENSPTTAGFCSVLVTAGTKAAGVAPSPEEGLRHQWQREPTRWHDRHSVGKAMSKRGWWWKLPSAVKGKLMKAREVYQTAHLKT